MIKKRLFVTVVALLISAVSEIGAANVLFFTCAYNRPDFIEVQYETFKKFMQDEYEYVVWNDASNPAMCKQIEDVCAHLGVRCVRIPQEIHDRPYLKRGKEPYHNPNVRHVNCVQYSLDTMGFDHDGVLVLIDSDMFLIRPLDVASLMEGYDIVSHMKGAKDGKGQERQYLWPGLCFLNMGTLPNKRTMNFNCGSIHGVRFDSGGDTCLYMEANPSIRSRQVPKICAYHLFVHDRFAPAHMLRQMPHVPEAARPAKYRQMGFNEKEIKFLASKPDSIEFLLDNRFLHYRAGTNYDGQSGQYSNSKTSVINQFISDLLTD